EAQTVGSRLADDPSENERGRNEVQIGQFLSVTRVPKDTRARTALDVAASGVNGEGVCAAGHDARNGQTFPFQFASQNLLRGKSPFAIHRPRRHVRIVNIAALRMKAGV